jgi:peptidyl-prolyl cis-trans isomerase-like 1
MAATRAGWRVGLGLAAACLVPVGGCGQAKVEPVAATTTPTPAETPASAPATASVAQSTPAPVAAVPAEPRFLQPFDAAALTDINIDDDIKLPPDHTATGKSTGTLHDELVSAWDSVKLIDANGQPQLFLAVLETDAGNVSLELHPEWAPNHVRNFVALARLGYFDGLSFDRIVRQVSSSDANVKLDVVEAAHPAGAVGEAGAGHLGYWLKPELDAKVPHAAGVVGACLVNGRAETASCRFYIGLHAAPALDGQNTIFGRVCSGLDILQKVVEQPVQDPTLYVIGATPLQPVVFRKVTIVEPAVDKSTANGHNKN